MCSVLFWGVKTTIVMHFFFLGKHDCDALKKEYMAKSKKKKEYMATHLGH